MLIASFNEPFHLAGWNIQPRTRYVVSHFFYESIAKQCEANKTTHWLGTVSNFASYARPYAGQNLNGRRLAVYRERGLGDNLMITALCGYIKHLYPDAAIDVYTQPIAAPAWIGNEEVRLNLSNPPTFDGIQRTEYHLLLEGLFESDTEPDQRCAYDTYLHVAGFDPKRVGPEWKRPRLFLCGEDQNSFAEWSQKRPVRYVMWHWNPSGAVRMYPPALAQEAILRLAEHVDVVVCGDHNSPDIPPPVLREHPRIHSYVGTMGHWRFLFPVIAHAACVVAPDSSVAHAAECWPDVPVVGLWGPFSPDDRVKYYRNHHALTSNVCPYAPCRQQYKDLPRAKCRGAEGYAGDDVQKYCRVMEAIPPQAIVDKVLSLI